MCLSSARVPTARCRWAGSRQRAPAPVANGRPRCRHAGVHHRCPDYRYPAVGKLPADSGWIRPPTASFFFFLPFFFCSSLPSVLPPPLAIFQRFHHKFCPKFKYVVDPLVLVRFHQKNPNSMAVLCKSCNSH